VDQLILESPMVIGIGGLFAAGLAGFFWTQTGQRVAGWIAIVLLLLTLITIVVSIQVETDQEKITHMLHDVAGALQRNDREYVFSHIHPQASATVQRAKTELPRYNFTEARVTRIKAITIDDSRKPETAVAEFNVIVALTVEGSSVRVPQFVKLYLTKQDGRWLVRDYEHSEPTAGFRQ
jgi:predicted lipid-binding transport protein (Tim44 family)